MRRRRSRPPASKPPALTYEGHLANANAEDLKRFARVWVGKAAAKLAKETARAAIREAMADPKAIRAALAALGDFERAALGLVKVRGQLVDTDAIAGALLMLGMRRSPADSRRGRFGSEPYFDALEPLLHRGLLMLRRMSAYETFRTSIDRYGRRPHAFADARVLAEVEPLSPVPLPIEPVRERVGTAKPPGEVALRLIATAEAIARLGGLALTAAGRVARPSASKLAKTVAWKESASADGALADPAEFHLQLWLASGLLVADETAQSLQLGPEAEALLERPFGEQAARWASAYESIAGWVEHMPAGVHVYGDDDSRYKTFHALRGALVVALAALPRPEAWYATSALSDAVYSRVGGHLALGSLPGFRAPYGAAPDEVARRRESWRREQRERWTAREQVWIERALAGPLYHLGLVEIAIETPKRGAPEQFFRLTPTGRQALWDVYRPQEPAGRARARRAPADAGCWVVQPNFDVVVFLDAATPARLRFVERVAVRLGAEGAAVSYRLTRESVYGALESGLPLTSILETLGEGARYPVPDAVARTVSDWAARRERLTVHLGARVLEFADATARDRAVAARGVSGEPVGDRFFLLAKTSRAPRGPGAIDYASAPARCVTVAEDGLVEVERARRDLLVTGEIAAWADPLSPDGIQWRLTRASVARAVGGGWTPGEILRQLDLRALDRVPAIVRVAVDAWAGGAASRRLLAAAPAEVLLVGDEQIAVAIGASKTLGAMLESRLGPCAFLVKRGQGAALRKALGELGLAVGKDAYVDKLVQTTRS